MMYFIACFGFGIFAVYFLSFLVDLYNGRKKNEKI